MDSSELHRVKQEFFLVRTPACPSSSYGLGNLSKNAGTYKVLIILTRPPRSSPDFAALVYQVRTCIALNNPSAVLSLLPTDSEDVMIRAVSSLARHIAATIPHRTKVPEEPKLCWRSLGIGHDLDAGDKRRRSARALVGTAFARAGEVEGDLGHWD